VWRRAPAGASLRRVSRDCGSGTRFGCRVASAETADMYPVLGPDELIWLARVAGLSGCRIIAQVAQAWQAAAEQARFVPPFGPPHLVVTIDPARGDALMDMHSVAALPGGGVVTTQANDLLHEFNPEGVKVRTLGDARFRAERMHAMFAHMPHTFRPNEFASPSGVCMGDGVLFLLDECRVMKLSLPEMSIVHTFSPAVDDARNWEDICDDPLAEPHALAILHGRLFVSCAGWNGATAGISIFDANALSFIGRFHMSPGLGPIGSEQGQWGSYPGGIAPFCGRIVVADPGNDRLQVFSEEGRIVRQVGGVAGCPHSLSSSDLTQQLVVSCRDATCVRIYNGAFRLVQQIVLPLTSPTGDVVGTAISVAGTCMWVACNDSVESEINTQRAIWWRPGKLLLLAAV